ncbi:maleylpyruvate isomerase family mycothiol-dependent enzyme [Streptomyces sp. IB201691-2A2]|uniref:maleylpyruvate isomerase family mycothiol-dependent enzyme n=1 Tax=Streptomyces sp. IB201691-2A2 TaxID=2561920 RepID=UPI00117E0DB1|nr:maleylpyruvate isomerase family mycothiol-dependent enzyme [Streptomyces sp. IB201691-2A2]TRO58455.1 maleylpyruvate isomerase family mycothiol-dependent enzyme [Streptomyces sp. IB201691-2A2]
MDRERVLSWTKAERLGLADFLDDLEGADWEVPSLCTGWTVRDVVAHLTLSTRTTLPGMVRGMVRARGDWERMEFDAARKRAAAFGPAELIAQFRETAASTRRAPLSAPLDPLVDVLVHGQDIARPLGRVRPTPEQQTIAALEHVVSSPFYGARKRLRGVRLVATDVDWSRGDGQDEARGPAGDLLLLATGRAAGLPGVTGPGAERLGTVL